MKIGGRASFLITSLAAVLAVGLTSGFYLEGRLEAWIDDATESELLRIARVGSELVELAPGTLSVAIVDPLADRIGVATDTRITVIAGDGVVLGDSHLSPGEVERVENHGSRPEVVAALVSSEGVSRRFSDTLHTEMLYTAVPYDRAGERGVVRAARPERDIQEALRTMRLSMGVAGLMGLAVALLVVLGAGHLMSRSLHAVITRARAATSADDRGAGHANATRSRSILAFASMADELDHMVETLAGERDRLETILEGMDDAVLAFDAEQRVTLVNAAAHDLLGLGEQPLGKTLLETVRTPALADLVDAAVSGRAGSTDVEIAGPRGKNVLAWASPLRATKGVVVVLHDVTEIRRLEEVRSDFVANVSHELRTPITVIRANVETLLDGAIDDPTHARAFASGILRNAERLSHLVSDLLDLSRIESRQWTLARDTIDLRSAALGAATALESQARDRDVDLSVDIDDGLSVVGDEKALDGVLVNLLDNAIKYTPGGGHVTVTASGVSDRIRIEVRDDGPGIEARHRERIFERFYRVDRGRSRQLGGTGLGLAIVKHLVEAMHGDVGVEPAHPRGSVFWVELPTSPPSERGEDAR